MEFWSDSDEPVFPITLAGLKTLSTAVCELDACKRPSATRA